MCNVSNSQAREFGTAIWSKRPERDTVFDKRATVSCENRITAFCNDADVVNQQINPMIKLALHLNLPKVKKCMLKKCT